MIQGVRLRPLVRHEDERGSLVELLRSDWPEFTRFGQAIITVNLPGVIRAWHWHTRQTDYAVVVSGTAKLPLYDGREGSPTRGDVEEYVLGDGNFAGLLIPPGVYHGYKTLGDRPALIVNFPDRVYDPADEHRIPFDTTEIPYRW